MKKANIFLTLHAIFLGSVMGYSWVHDEYITVMFGGAAAICFILYKRFAIAALIKDHKTLSDQFTNFKKQFFPNE